MMICGFCGSVVVSIVGRRGKRCDSRYCDRRCRQAAWRLRRELVQLERDTLPKRLAYADPPYVGKSSLYRGESTYAGEVDHRELIASLVDAYDGWALSASAASLRVVLPLCPPEVRVCSWQKPHAVPPASRGIHNVWEPLIVMPARHLRPGVPDSLRALPARLGGELIGRKPLRFCAWLFRVLGAQPIDSLADLYPGTGIVAHAWSAFVQGVELLERRHVVASSSRRLDPSLRAHDDESSPAADDDTSRQVLDDVSRAGGGDGLGIRRGS